MACSSCGSRVPNSNCSSCAPKQFHIFPDPPAPHELDNLAKSFCFVIPSSATNLVRNPLTFPPGYTASVNNGGVFPLVPPGSTFTYVTNVGSPVSPFAIRIDPGPGVGVEVSTSLTLTPMGAAGLQYAGSGYILLPRGTTVEVLITDSGTNTFHVASQFVTGTGRWQRVEVSYAEFANVQRSFIIRSAGINEPVDFWYVSGLQVEEIAPGNPLKATTFTAGFNIFDWPGLRDLPDGAPERWDGEPHNSISLRSRFTYSSGTCLSLEDCGFMVEGIQGFNMPTPNVIKQSYATIDGSHYQDSYYNDSVASIVLRQINCNPRINDLMCARACLTRMVGHMERDCRDLQSLRYQPLDENCEPCGEELEIVGSYVGGLEGLLDNAGMQQSFVLQFERQPFVRGAVRRTEGVLAPTAGVNNSVFAPGFVGPAEYDVAICYRGRVASSPVWVFYAEQIDWSQMSVQNIDTGAIISFTGTVGDNTDGLITNNEYVIISTEPTRSYAVRYDPVTGNSVDISGFLQPGSALNSFTMIPGVNNLRYIWPDPAAITNGANNGQPVNELTGDRPPSLLLAIREMFFGISNACCAPAECNPRDVINGFVYLDDLGDIEPYVV